MSRPVRPLVRDAAPPASRVYGAAPAMSDEADTLPSRPGGLILEHHVTDPEPVDDGELMFASRRHKYLVAILAREGEVVWPSAFLAARRLRFETYRRYRWLDASDQDADGGESDQWDPRAIQVGVLRRTDKVELIATSRLIVRRTSRDRIPVEFEYPEAFPSGTANVMDAELSRLVSVSPDKRERALASMACQRAMLGWALANGVNQAYGIVEDHLVRRLEATGIPHHVLTDLKPLPSFGDSMNRVIRIDPREMARDVLHIRRVPFATYLFFRGLQNHQGSGASGRRLMIRTAQRANAIGLA